METFKCHHCRDTGYVRAYHPTTMHEACEVIRGSRERSKVVLRYCDVPCFCEHEHTESWKCSGEVRAYQTHQMMKRKNKNAAMPIRANDERVIRVDVLARTATQLETIIAWAREYVAQVDERRAAKEAQYAPFDAWNAGVETEA